MAQADLRLSDGGHKGGHHLLQGRLHRCGVRAARQTLLAGARDCGPDAGDRRGVGGHSLQARRCEPGFLVRN